MSRSNVAARHALLTSALVLTGLVSTARADGTEQLGFNPNVAPGSAVVVAGTGLGGFGANVPGTISLDVPAGVAIAQVLLYWEGHAATELEQGATDTIVVEGVQIEGDRIGGPTRFFNMAWSSTYRADITALGLVGNGLNELDVSGTDFVTANNGAGVLVVVDDGVNTTDIAIADGDDNAFIGFSPPLDTTVPVTYTFAAANVDRLAPLAMFFGSAAPKRPSIIQIWVDGVLSESLIDQLNDGEGPEFDIVRHDVSVPAGATSVTVQVLSADSGIGPYAGKLPVSLTWITSAFVLQGVPCTGTIGDLVWSDEDCDGLQGELEDGLAGVTVLLKDDLDNLLDTTVTDAFGNYLFTDLCAGTYVVEVDTSTLPPGFVEAPCNVGGDDAIDNDCSPALVVLAADDTVDLTVDFGYCPPPSGGGEGCTPGYWKQKQHFDSYPDGILPGDLFSKYFEDAFPGKTLLQVLGAGGGGLTALGRHTVAAFLNAHSDGVSYDLEPDDVVDAFNDVFPGEKDDYNGVKDEFADFNEQGCPLN